MRVSNLSEKARQRLLALLVFAATAAVAVLWIVHSERQERVEARVLAADLAADHAQSLQRGIERALSATYAIAALVRKGQGELPEFDAVATEMLPYYPGIAALGLSPRGVIRNVVPLAGNEKSIGFNQLGDSAQNKEAILARDTGKLTLAGPLKLAQGGLGVVGRLPIFLGDEDGRAFRRHWKRRGFSCSCSVATPTSCGASCPTLASASALMRRRGWPLWMTR